MTEKKRKGIPGPVAAIIAIVMVWLGSQTTPFWKKDDVPSDPAPVEESTTPAETTMPEETETPVKPMVLDEAPFVMPSSDWSTYHGGTALTGVVDVSLPEAPEVLWRYQADSGVLYAPVADDEKLYFAALKGEIVALDLEGAEQWKHRYLQEPYRDGRERTERFDAPMALFNNRLFAGAMSGLLYSFDATSGETAWTYDVAGPVLGSVNYYAKPGVDEQIFIIEQSEGALHSLDFETGAMLWKSEGVERCDGSPSVHNGQIVFGSCAAALHVFSAEEQGLVKNIEFDTDSQVAGGVSIVGHSAYTGSHSGRVFRTDLRTGEILWTNEDSFDEVFTTPAVNADQVIVASFDGLVYALDKATGKKLWGFDTLGIPKSPVIAQDKIVVSSDGILYILSLESGEKLWSYEVSDEISAPAIIHGMIVVGSEDGTVTAFGLKKE